MGKIPVKIVSCFPHYFLFLRAKFQHSDKKSAREKIPSCNFVLFFEYYLFHVIKTSIYYPICLHVASIRNNKLY